MRWKFPVVFIISTLSVIGGVDKTNFRVCEQSSFCKRCRNVEPNKSTFELSPDKASLSSTSTLQSKLVDKKYNVEYTFELSALESDIFRIKINEANPLKPRFEVPFALAQEPVIKPLKIVESTKEKIIVKAGDNVAHIYRKPFKIEFFQKGVLVGGVNTRGLLKFEYLRKKPERAPEPAESGDNAQTVDEVEVVEPEFSAESGAWEENFKSAHDSKPNGPEAVALDFSFPEAVAAYGLPEHSDSFLLKSTKSGEPYRLYNLDVFEYELDNKMALYASIPVMFAHGPKSTTGVLWLNSAETWVDVMSQGDQNMLSSIVNLVSGSNSKTEIDAHFMSESGIIDAFFLMGPTPDDVQMQYASLTGTTPLPQMFALGYHQSRWNYNDEDDVRTVNQRFDEHNIPMDVIWLDIEHTDNKKYFTWDPIKFSHPEEMVKNLTDKGRKLVAIVDPHIKRDAGYFLHNDAETNGYYVKTPEGKDYEGWCWPGSSSYLDFLDPVVREYYANRFLLENYKGSTLNTYIWNDMNEPSVFSGPEVTMPKDMVHHGGWEHRHIHNIYGLLHTMSTYEGLLRRSEGKLRPFILTRSAFSGSQRYVAIWTGDNMAEWSHLKASIPMCLSLSIAGMTLCGSDVGGFFRNPEPELFTRWFQAGAFQPFFRSHSHIDTKRREPWSMNEETTSFVRAAIQKRYGYLPYWYTLMYEQETSASLVMRPLWTEFPQEEATFAIEDEYLLGRSLLVHPVVEKGATSVNVYFPGKNEVWYDADTFEKYTENGNVKISVHMGKIPVFIRGGAIIPMKLRVRRSSKFMKEDPYTLFVALDVNESATGTLYIDDEESFNYRKGDFIYLRLEYKNKKLSVSHIHENPKFQSKAWVERVVILGASKPASFAELITADNITQIQTNYSVDQKLLVVRKPGVYFNNNWEMKFLYENL